MTVTLWLAMAALLLVAAIFFLWPLRQQQRSGGAPEDPGVQIDTNVALFKEHLAELALARDSGRLTPEAFEQLKLEQERALLEDERELARTGRRLGTLRFGSAALILTCVLALGTSAVLYYHWGSGQDIRLQQLQRDKVRLDWHDIQNQRDPDPARTEALIEALEKRLSQRPDNLQYHFLLARQAMELGDYDRAIEAYEAIIERDPESPMVLAELAQALFLRDQNRMTPRIARLAEAALALDGEETTALGLAGINAFSNSDFESAIDYWQRAVDVLGPNAPSSRALMGGIERARREMSADQGEPDYDPLAGEPSASLTVEVSLAEGAQVEPDQWVFVYARAWQGSPMPLAIQRLKVEELPATIILDDTMAMSTEATITQAKQVELVARVSQSGTASPQPGDWQGTMGPVDTDADNGTISLEIDREITE